ncbi:tetratricopeptide repeat protein [Rhizobium lusitanum]|uniref:Tetratricopeptide (TPR) repeat protein n=1 Tax=Rhizobium lusitanum TaxID=293958 RepID=A0A7X0MDZ3_9HYPH|nr:tetratricopeptide repeat protein [Rhizobium lusitanum]MBB6485483.1 tetratricopeptide (TPR) repeat protein [Rhizobium lusitanum]
MQVNSSITAATALMLALSAWTDVLFASSLTPMKTAPEATCFSARGEQAIALCTTELAEQKSPDAFANRAEAYGFAMQYDKAVADYTSAIELSEPKGVMLPTYYQNRAGAYFSMKKYELAIQDYTRALDLNPKLSTDFVSRGMAYAALNKDKEAFADFDRAMEDKFAKPVTLRVRADLLLTRGEPDRAIQDYRDCLTLQPKNAYAMIGIANAYLKKNMIDSAFSQYDLALSTQPICAECLIARGDAFAKIGNQEKAIADYNAALAFPDQFIAPATKKDAEAALRKLQ